MTPALAFRLAAVGFAALAIAATAWSARHRSQPPLAQPTPPPTSKADPARAELERCQVLGERGASDEACLTAWAQQRRRFLGAAEPKAR